MPYSDFNHNLQFDVILNFVGVGDPAQAKEMGAKIFDVTEHYDNLALKDLKTYPASKHVTSTKIIIKVGGLKN